MGLAQDTRSGLQSAPGVPGSGAGVQPFSCGAPRIGEFLSGGLARGALHEIYAPAVADVAAASGFAVALAYRAAGGRPVAWVRQDFADVETAPLWSRARGAGARSASPPPRPGARCRRGAPRRRGGDTLPGARGSADGALGGAQSPRPHRDAPLVAGASRSGIALLMVRIAARPAPSAAMTRWSVRAGASAPLEANAPGCPAFAATLPHHRGRCLAQRLAGAEIPNQHAIFGRPHRGLRSGKPPPSNPI